MLVGGCSFSSPFSVPVNCSWPNIVANRLGYELIDEAAMAGSNYRIWRTLVNHIRSGNVKNTDKVIVQYTEPHRTEYYTPTTRTPLMYNDQHQFHERYKDGYIGKMKWGMEQNLKGHEQTYAKLKIFLSCDEWEREMFEINHTMFEGYLRSEGFEHVYFLATLYLSTLESHYPIIDCTNVLKTHSLKGDPWHLSEGGHLKVADKVSKVINI